MLRQKELFLTEPGELAHDIVKAESSGEDPRATGGLVSNLPHPRVNKIKQLTVREPILSVHSLAMPRSGPDDASHGRGGGGRGVTGHCVKIHAFCMG